MVILSSSPFVCLEIVGRLEKYSVKMWAPIQWSNEDVSENRPKMPTVYHNDSSEHCPLGELSCSDTPKNHLESRVYELYPIYMSPNIPIVPQ